MEKKKSFEPDTVVQVCPDQVASAVGDEIAILNLKNGVYYGLNPTGARIWEYLQKPVQVEKLLDHLQECFDVERETCRADLLELLENLHDAELIAVVEDNHVSHP